MRVIRNLLFIAALCSGHCFLYSAQQATKLEQPLNAHLAFLLGAGEGDHRLKEVQDLIAQDIPVLGTSPGGNTALMDAILYGNPQIARLLIETIERQYGKEMLQNYINMRSTYTQDYPSGYTALSWAANRGFLATTKLLLEKGAQDSIEVTNSQGDTPLMLATFQNHLNTVALLIQHGAHINTQDTHGRTALMYAAQSNNLRIIALLLEKGADYSLHDDKQQTAYDHADKNPYAQKLLASYEAKMKVAHANQPLVKAAIEEHIIPPLAHITAQYTMPHAQEERAMIESNNTTT